ncbi:hypothetical protein FH972_024452 [Carpinus fangiana]|uniref:Uncharacterized protein n=1 Tax=Carpinus fangiana TaxID=176857 RepID=A0A5N6KYH5_9ROSI|nr:hypothetical protein FH972_024452 [Carpinus fangiana]
MSFLADDGLERLQGLHHDLIALYESKLPTIDRLLLELESRAAEFQSLLDKKPKNDASFKKLQDGTLTVDDEQLSINDEFKNRVLQVSEELSLDELEAAELYYRAQTHADSFDRSPIHASILLFHTRRQFLLDCLRLCTHGAANQDEDDKITEPMRELISLILHQGAQPMSGSTYWHKCLSSMTDIEDWLHRISDRLSAFAMTNPGVSNEAVEIMEMQQKSLLFQHEALASIMADLIKLNHTKVEDLRQLVPRLRRLDRCDIITVHYLPSLTGLIHQFALNESACSLSEARSLHTLITSTKDNEVWTMRNLQASAIVIWLAEYSGRYMDNPGAESLPNVDLDAEADARSAQFMEALRDGAFHFLLIVSRELKRDNWFVPARHGLTDFLTRDSPAIQVEPLQAQDFFKKAVMERLQQFVESFISNMPDTIRRLKNEEDEQRRLLHSQIQSRQSEESLHLEQFLVLASYAFEGFPEASEAFWLDPDGNLSGFLQWASQRLTTPRAAAFCEALIALSEGEECAGPAHRFLLADSPQTNARLRRNSPLSWHHIFTEVDFYASRIRDRLSAQSNASQGFRADGEGLVEKESPMMLESYLRLMAHVAVNSPEARNWLISSPDHHAAEDLLWMCHIPGEPRLRACAFNALTALLNDKDRERRDSLWAAIDETVCGRFSVSSRPANMQISPHVAEQMFLKSLIDGFELPASFVRLVRTLLGSCLDDDLLHDSLPFPETLGAAYRLSGIDGYIDFVMDGVFVGQTHELADATQLRITRLECLLFVSSCLQSFNENLVVFANTTKVNVDAAIQTSNISAYVKLHPFARVMEWLYNDRVIKALFEAAKQDVTEVNMAAADSPLVMSLVQSIEAIILILSLQSTYLNIVRPTIKIESNNRRAVVANSALASFEDAILNNLSFVSALGLYCGSGHQRLVEVSLKLMERLSASRKLNVPTTLARGQKLEKSRLLTSLEVNDEADSISRSLILEMRVDEREHEQGPFSSGWAIKTHLLRFLNHCIGNAPDRPTVAHLLLGFSCGSKDLDISSDSLMDNGCALIHAIIAFLRDCPEGDASGLLAWLVTTRTEAMQILQKLWRSPLSARITLQELRSSEFLFAQMTHQNIVRPDTPWDGRVMGEDEFFLTESADAYASFLTGRSALLEYVASECRAAKELGSTSLVARIKSTLLGVTVLSNGERVQNPSLTDFLDFLELETADGIPLPESTFFNPADFDICKPVDSSEYELGWVEQLLILRQHEVRAQPQFPATENDLLQADAENMLACVIANNRLSRIRNARQAALNSWTQLVTVALEVCEFDATQRSSFVLQLLQLILPRLELALQSDQTSAVVLGQLVKTLLQNLDSGSIPGEASAGSEAVNDRLSQMFRVALNGIVEVQARTELREICCQICHGYLSRLLGTLGTNPQRRQALGAIKAAGSRLVEILCDEAYNGEGTSRISSLMVLISSIVLANKQGSKAIVDNLSRINFIHVVVEGIKTLPAELQQIAESSISSASSLIAYQEAAMSLLLCLAQTRYGAAQVLNAGLFSAIKESELFSADPDIGFAVDSDPQALTTYFRLMLGMLRIVTTIVLSSGAENEQTIVAARGFLQQYRPSIVSVFKRSARIGSSDKSAVNEELLGGLVDTFTILMSASGFLDDDDDNKEQAQRPRLFT